MKKRVRIKDIADKVGVSTGTVDRVLHNRGNVAEDVKQKILKAVDELGYERNQLASALAYNHKIKVAALLPNPALDPYWEQPNQGILKALKSVQHYGLLMDLVYFDHMDPNDFVKCATKILANEPAAFLFPPLFVKEAKWLIQQCQVLNIPYVTINTELKNSGCLCYVGQDSYQSGVLGARLLNFGLNENETVCILNLDYIAKTAYHLIEKEQGFKDYFREHKRKKINIIKKSFDNFEDENKLELFLRELIEQHPKLHGIFVTNSRAYKIVDYLEIITDREIKLVGFDLISENLAYLKADKINFLINQNPNEQGYLAVMSIFKHLILKEEIEEIQHLALDIVVKENFKYYLNKQNSGKTII